MEILKLESELVDPKIKDCKGLYWRGVENIFVDKSGRIKQTKEIRLLKRKSCPGCEKCFWIFDELIESISCEKNYSNILSDIKHGKIYRFGFSTSTDWESGFSEIDDIYFVEVKE